MNGGKVPSSLKLVKTMPVYKGKGTKLDCNSYRSISLLLCTSKMKSEKNFDKRLPHRYEFRQNRSTAGVITIFWDIQLTIMFLSNLIGPLY